MAACGEADAGDEMVGCSATFAVGARSCRVATAACATRAACGASAPGATVPACWALAVAKRCIMSSTAASLVALGPMCDGRVIVVVSSRCGFSGGDVSATVWCAARRTGPEEEFQALLIGAGLLDAGFWVPGK